MLYTKVPISQTQLLICLARPQLRKAQASAQQRYEQARQKYFDEHQATQQHIEQALSHWKRTSRKNPPVSAHISSVAGDLSGEWTTKSGTTIKLFIVKPNTYHVIFSSGRCLSHWTLERTGTYKDGTLLLNRPVMETYDIDSDPWIYNRLFTTDTPKGQYLISDAALQLQAKSWPLASFSQKAK